MQLYLIRHAESENNAKPVHLRVEDPPLTEVGKRQAEHLANWMRTLRIDVLITSPFLRTLQTTRAIIDATQQPVAVWHDLFERGGCYRGHVDHDLEGGMGLGRTGILNLLPDADIDATVDDMGWWGGRDRETQQEATVRATTVISRLIASFGNSGKHVVAVIHADFKREVLLQMLHGIADANVFGPMRNTGITKVDFDGTRWRLDWLNSVSHLPADLITGNEE